ncbi:MAG TPA: CDP-diacylglycerol diphosphatase [Stellaceae bacterium]|nr:CDP-diacylglycerol diphosphatase [Stellaceae bacterium]
MRPLFVALAALLALAGAARADPAALWKIISEKCLPNWREHGDAAPCAKVDLDKGYVVLKDRAGATQYLLMPTDKITGIDDPAVVAPNARNYFADAWAERHFTEEAAKRALPRDMLSLAINSAYGRTQNQLHIHIDCIRPDVRDALVHGQAAIGNRWAPFPVPLAGRHYRAMRVAGETLDGVAPFMLVADGIPGARSAMAKDTIVVVGLTLADGKPGFAILSDEADLTAGDHGSGEELQDHSCALAK